MSFHSIARFDQEQLSQRSLAIMKLTTATLLSIQLPFLVSAHYNPHLARDNIPEWIPGGPNDFRGPCPMMNTLANHGYLPRDGGNITKPNAVQALSSALNFNTSLAELMFEMAIIANPEPNATFFTLYVPLSSSRLAAYISLSRDGSLADTDCVCKGTSSTGTTSSSTTQV